MMSVAFVFFRLFDSNRPDLQDVGLGIGVEVVFGMTAVQRPDARLLSPTMMSVAGLFHTEPCSVSGQSSPIHAGR